MRRRCALRRAPLRVAPLWRARACARARFARPSRNNNDELLPSPTAAPPSKQNRRGAIVGFIFSRPMTHFEPLLRRIRDQKIRVLSETPKGVDDQNPLAAVPSRGCASRSQPFDFDLPSAHSSSVHVVVWNQPKTGRSGEVGRARHTDLALLRAPGVGRSPGPTQFGAPRFPNLQAIVHRGTRNAARRTPRCRFPPRPGAAAGASSLRYGARRIKCGKGVL